MVKSSKRNEVKVSEDVGTALKLRLKEHFVGTRPGRDKEVKAMSLNRESMDPPAWWVDPPGLPQGLALTKHPECVAKLILE